MIEFKRPGGNPEAWPHTKHILQAMSAKVNGKPCCNWIGGEGAGHYVKTVKILLRLFVHTYCYYYYYFYL